MANGMLPNTSQAAPDVAALGKFGAWPVLLYTGTVSVSIPIYNIKIGNFDLPVKLDYHSGGVKVEEMAGWTYYQHVVSGITQVSVSGSGSIDQLLCYPEDAKVTSNTYRPLWGVTSSHATNGLFNIYEYDTFQRLMTIRDYSGKIVKQFDYQLHTTVQ